MVPTTVGETPSRRLASSKYHDAFLEHNRRTRDLEGARRMLSLEWHYLGPLLGQRTDSRILDLACGSGTQTMAWAERGGRVTAVDFDVRLLASGRNRFGGLATEAAHPPVWSAGDATRLPFRDQAFDLVFCNSLVEHVPQWGAVLAEAARVLRSGGVLLLYTTNRHCPLQQEVNHFPFYSWLPGWAKRRIMGWIMEHRRDLVNYTDFPAVNWFTFPGMRKALRAHGFDPFDRLDLGARQGVKGTRGVIIRAMTRWPVLKWFYYLGVLSMAMYGVRRPLKSS